MKLYKKIAMAEADGNTEGYPDYEELASVALKAVAKHMRKKARG